ncbi:predicted protein [Botrytis cinerea T4]|uniref:Uncharacterized protein n=1 Tax=Botryotinia fuckeliana (strain T4) TaxID=999810 RepID=G2XNK1_BOTF4|nr:predicted protein [Botrytis cinerea T4]
MLESIYENPLVYRILDTFWELTDQLHDAVRKDSFFHNNSNGRDVDAF